MCVCTNRKPQHTHTHILLHVHGRHKECVCSAISTTTSTQTSSGCQIGAFPPLLRPSYLYMKSRKKATSLVCVAMFGRHHPPKRAACLSGVKEEGIHKLPDLSSHSSVCRLFIKREGRKGLPCLREYPPPLSWVTFRSHMFFLQCFFWLQGWNREDAPLGSTFSTFCRLSHSDVEDDKGRGQICFFLGNEEACGTKT